MRHRSPRGRGRRFHPQTWRSPRRLAARGRSSSNLGRARCRFARSHRRNSRGWSMKHLNVWHKLALMGAVFILPFAVVTDKMVSSVNTLGTEFARREMLGLEYYTPLLKLLQDLQQ